MRKHAVQRHTTLLTTDSPQSKSSVGFDGHAGRPFHGTILKLEFVKVLPFGVVNLCAHGANTYTRIVYID